jgi:hypothetical protein
VGARGRRVEDLLEVEPARRILVFALRIALEQLRDQVGAMQLAIATLPVASALAAAAANPASTLLPTVVVKRLLTVSQYSNAPTAHAAPSIPPARRWPGGSTFARKVAHCR